MRIVSSVIIGLALASPARLARAGDQGADVTGAAASFTGELLRPSDAAYEERRRDAVRGPQCDDRSGVPQGCAKLLEGG